jgi:hypothetical protein
VVLLLAAQGVRERTDAELRRGVRRPRGAGGQPGGGVRHQHQPAGRAQRREARLREQHRPDQVHVDLRPQLGGVEIGHRVQVDDPGDVQQRVEVLGQAVEARERVEVGQVRHHRVGAREATLEVGCPVGVARQQPQLVATLVQGAGHGRADSGPGTGDEVLHRGPRVSASAASGLVG